jgi:hypothetical protein
MMKTFFIFLIALGIGFTSAQNYSGPAEGSVASGNVTSTDNFQKLSVLPEPVERGIRNVYKTDDDKIVVPPRFTLSKEGTNHFDDPNVNENMKLSDTSMAVLLKSFNGMGETNSIPPDPYIAVGPTHVMATVNSRFAIWDKEGNLVKQIDAGLWYRGLFNLASPFDPKVLYDHFAKRWIMVWLDQDNATQLGTFYVSVSDDSIPTGTWYNWVLPSNKNGNTAVDNWGDYQGVGYDKNAIYITSNQFRFSPSNYQYVKIRIVPKAQLYNNTAGQVTWTDFWNIGYPAGGPGGNVFNIRPSITYDESDTYYLMHAPNYSAGSDFMALYKITNPLTNPVLTGTIVPVSFTYPAPNGNQLGGSTILVETGGSNIRNEPKVRNGFIWGVHNIRNPNSPANSSVRYVKINLTTSSAVEDAAMGAANYWYSYPALEVDERLNTAITYSRSATTEYIGAYYTYRADTDPPGLRGSLTLQTGKGNYVKDYGSGRNRWGDYNGIWLDPSDNLSMWMFTEYVAAPNIWGTWVGKVRLVPFSGIYPAVSVDVLDFGNVEVNTISDTLNLFVSNYGDADLVINNLPAETGPFRLLESLSFPLTLGTYDSLRLSFVFNPTDTGLFVQNFPISTNDPSFSSIALRGYSYKIVPANNNVLYASTGLQTNGNTLIVNKQSGSANILGPSKYSELKNIAMNPKTNIIYGIAVNNDIVRVNAEKGDAYRLLIPEISELSVIAFDTTGQMYVGKRSGEIYAVDLVNRNFVLTSTAKINLSSMAFHPFTNELWAAVFQPIGSNRDRLYKVDLTTGDTLLVGKVGSTNSIPALAFDASGALYGISGHATQINNLLLIDQNTGVGTVVGATGFKHITGLAHSISGVVSVKNDQTPVPTEYSLKQNYPNPFNPSTVIEFSLPEEAKVKLIIYNLLGEKVGTLVNSDMNRGIHKYEWDASSLSSGIYFYEINAAGKSGKEFSLIRKMILMK